MGNRVDPIVSFVSAEFNESNNIRTSVTEYNSQVTLSCSSKKSWINIRITMEF